MAKTQLTALMRNSLRSLASSYEPDNTQLIEATLELQTAIKESWESKWPQEEMEILRKYGHSNIPCTINLTTLDAEDNIYTSKLSCIWDEDYWPTVPLMRPYGYEHNTLTIQNAPQDIIDKQKRVADLYNKHHADKTLLKDTYNDIIKKSRYIEDIESVWPEAKEVLEPFRTTTPTAIAYGDTLKKLKPVKKTKSKVTSC